MPSLHPSDLYEIIFISLVYSNNGTNAQVHMIKMDDTYINLWE